MKNLKNKLNKKGGFTLIEMLIVVAIIAILVAVSIPLVAGALERTRQATDAANERSAKAEVVIAYLSDGAYTSVSDFKTGTVYFYDAANGKLVKTFAEVENDYGKCTAHHKDAIIATFIDANGEVHLKWVTAADQAANTVDGSWDKNLCRDAVNG